MSADTTCTYGSLEPRASPGGGSPLRRRGSGRLGFDGSDSDDSDSDSDDSDSDDSDSDDSYSDDSDQDDADQDDSERRLPRHPPTHPPGPPQPPSPPPHMCVCSMATRPHTCIHRCKFDGNSAPARRVMACHGARPRGDFFCAQPHPRRGRAPPPGPAQVRSAEIRPSEIRCKCKFQSAPSGLGLARTHSGSDRAACFATGWGAPGSLSQSPVPAGAARVGLGPSRQAHSRCTGLALSPSLLPFLPFSLPHSLSLAHTHTLTLYLTLFSLLSHILSRVDVSQSVCLGKPASNLNSSA